MQTITKTYNIYNFDELSEEIQKQLIKFVEKDRTEQAIEQLNNYEFYENGDLYENGSI